MRPYASLPEPGPYAQAKLDNFAREAVAANAVRDKDMMGPNLLANLRRVAAATSLVDAEIGALVAKLTQKKLIDNTLIIFTSPSGSLFGRHGLWGSGDASDPVNMYEEVVATPMLWSWRGHVVPQATRPEMVSAYDLVPTICDITPARLPDRNLCGRSYLEIASGKPLPKKEPWRTMVFAESGGTAMARTDRYTLVVRNDGKGPGELYDDRVDPREKVNQYDNPQFMTVKATLSADLGKWKRGLFGVGGPGRRRTALDCLAPTSLMRRLIS